MVAYYSEGSAALAVDLYDDARSGVSDRYTAAPVVLDRTVKIRRGVAWASEPLSIDDDELAAARLSQLMRTEMARPYRDTILTNRKNDPACVGWTRIARGAKSCGFCRMLADRGAVYREETATFASHDDCQCTAAPAFKGRGVGPEADTVQYMASKRRRTAKERAFLRDYIAGNYPD
jgi:hypothetical protein